MSEPTIEDIGLLIHDRKTEAVKAACMRFALRAVLRAMDAGVSAGDRLGDRLAESGDVDGIEENVNPCS